MNNTMRMLAGAAATLALLAPGTARAEAIANESGLSTQIWYVSPDGTGAGGSWEDAASFTNVLADEALAAGDEIRLLAGIYPLAAQLATAKAVAIRGGFSGTGGQRAEGAVSVLDGQRTVPPFKVTTASGTNAFERRIEHETALAERHCQRFGDTKTPKKGTMRCTHGWHWSSFCLRCAEPMAPVAITWRPTATATPATGGRRPSPTSRTRWTSP